MSNKITKQLLTLGMLLGFLAVTAVVLLWYQEKAEILIGAWIGLMTTTVKEYFGEPGDANGSAPK